LNIAVAEWGVGDKLEGIPKHLRITVSREKRVEYEVQVKKAAKIAVSHLRVFDPEPCRHYTFIFGRPFLQEESVEKALIWLLEIALSGAEKARKALIKILEDPIWKSRGAKKKLTDEERQLKKKEGNPQHQQHRRALRYYDRAWQRYKDETSDIADPAKRWRIAINIADEEFSRGTPAFMDAKGMFLTQVKKNLR
jgi:hypothetical protein